MFFRAEVARALGCTLHEVLRLEREGLLHPRRDAKQRRVYRESEVLALAATRAASKKKIGSGETEAAVLDLLDAGREDADIVRALRVPFDLVARVRAAASGAPPPAAPAIPLDDLRALETERAERRARVEARRARRLKGHSP